MGSSERCTVRNVTLVGFVHTRDLADSAGRGNLHPAFEVCTDPRIVSGGNFRWHEYW